MLALVALLAVGVGVVLGLFGGGGSILSVPLLVYVAGLPADEAIATSLLVVAVTSLVGVVPHARAGRVRWRAGLSFGAAGMAGAYLGGRASSAIPAPVLLGAFAVMMLVTARAMLRRPDTSPAPARPAAGDRPLAVVLGQGAAVGLVTGLVGAGGGFVVVPALVLFAGLAMPAAVGTSLLVIAMNAFAGLAGQLATVPVDWALAALVSVTAVSGAVAGAHLAGRVDQAALRRAFGWFVLVMGAVVLLQQAPPGVSLLVLASPLAVAAGRRARSAARVAG